MRRRYGQNAEKSSTIDVIFEARKRAGVLDVGVKRSGHATTSTGEADLASGVLGRQQAPPALHQHRR